MARRQPKPIERLTFNRAELRAAMELAHIDVSVLADALGWHEENAIDMLYGRKDPRGSVALKHRSALQKLGLLHIFDRELMVKRGGSTETWRSYQRGKP